MKLLLDFLPLLLFFVTFKYADGQPEWAAAFATEHLGFLVSGGKVGPTEAPIWKRCQPYRIGRPIAAMICFASNTGAPRSSGPRSTANSSPPTRATIVAVSQAAASRCAAVLRHSSPAA